MILKMSKKTIEMALSLDSVMFSSSLMTVVFSKWSLVSGSFWKIQVSSHVITPSKKIWVSCNLFQNVSLNLFVFFPFLIRRQKFGVNWSTHSCQVQIFNSNLLTCLLISISHVHFNQQLAVNQRHHLFGTYSGCTWIPSLWYILLCVTVNRVVLSS